MLEPHHAPLSAVNFSPDGRRIITVSLEESYVTVWKVGSSITGFFNVGGPPRQGTGFKDPFKRITFTRVDDRELLSGVHWWADAPVPLGSTGALSDVQISWPGPRQARVVIKETALTFET